MTPEDQAAEIFRTIEELAKDAARQIMMAVVENGFSLDQMEMMVDGVVDWVREKFSEDGTTSDHGVDVAVAHYRRSLVAEGSRISRSMAWEGGTA